MIGSVEKAVLCDFCSACAPAWLYPADTFLDQHGSISKGSWLACDECHRLIEAGDRGRLADRVLLTDTVRSGAVSKRLARQYARDLHGRFFIHRTGEARRLV